MAPRTFRPLGWDSVSNKSKYIRYAWPGCCVRSHQIHADARQDPTAHQTHRNLTMAGAVVHSAQHQAISMAQIGRWSFVRRRTGGTNAGDARYLLSPRVRRRRLSTPKGWQRPSPALSASARSFQLEVACSTHTLPPSQPPPVAPRPWLEGESGTWLGPKSYPIRRPGPALRRETRKA